MEPRIPDPKNNVIGSDERELFATRRSILTKLSARMKRRCFDAEESPVLSSFLGKGAAETIPAR